MKVKELIEELRKFDENMEVVYHCDDRCSTIRVDEVSTGNEYYRNDTEEVIIIY